VINFVVQRCLIAFLVIGASLYLFYNATSVLAVSEQPISSYEKPVSSVGTVSEGVQVKAPPFKKTLHYQYVSRLVTSKILFDRQYYPESLDFSLPANWSLGWEQKPSYKSTWGIPPKPEYAYIPTYITADKFVKTGQSIDNWDELITIEVTNPRCMISSRSNSSSYQPPNDAWTAVLDFSSQLSSIEKRIKKNNPQAKIESLYIRMNSNDTLMSVNYLDAAKSQEELIRFIRNQGNLFMIRYASKAPFLQDERKKKQWMDWIDSQTFQTSVKKFNFWNVYAEDVVRNIVVPRINELPQPL
jgi:hypothetical protein